MVLETWFSDFKVAKLEAGAGHSNSSTSANSPGGKWAHTLSTLHELGEVFLIGGISSVKDLNALDENIYCLNLRTLTWEILKPKGSEDSTCAKRAFHTSTQVSDYELVIFGGWTGQKERDNNVYVFNALQKTWKTPVIEGSSKPEPRQGHSAVKINAADIAVYGGWSGSAFCDTLYLLDTCNWTWSKVDTVGVSPCLADHNCYMHQWWLLLNGGFGMQGENTMTHALDLITKEWKEQTESGKGALMDFALDRIAGIGQSEVCVGSHLVRLGGCDVNSGLYEDRNYSNVLEARKIQTGESENPHVSNNEISFSDIEYGPLQVDLITPRAYHTCIQASKHCLLAYGGRDKTQCFNDMWAIMLPDKLVLEQSNSAMGEKANFTTMVHPSLLRGIAKEERLIERQVARSQISDLVSDLRNSIADKDTTLKLEKESQKNKIEWLQEQIKCVKSDLEQLHQYKESLDNVQ